MFDFSSAEWAKFSKTEQRIIVLIRQHDVIDHERIRTLLGWPLEPMHQGTYSRHWRRIQAKMTGIRRGRYAEDDGTQTKKN